MTGTQSDLVRRALQQETVLLSGSRVGLPSGPPAPASTAGSPCERKPPATWVATPPPPRGPWSNGDLQGDDLPGTTVQGAGPSHSL